MIRTLRWLVLPVLAAVWLSVPAVPLAAAAAYRDCDHLAFAAGADLHRCDRADAVVIGEDLRDINLARSNLARLNAGCDPDIGPTNLSGARIDRAILTDALLCDVSFIGADLHGSDLRRVALEDANLSGANLSRAVLDGANAGFASFVGANLSSASWIGASAPGATFDRADLRRLDLRGSDLRATSFVGADLRDARLDGSDLSDADLTGARVNASTSFAGVTYANTTCPDGSNSDHNGGTCTGH